MGQRDSNRKKVVAQRTRGLLGVGPPALLPIGTIAFPYGFQEREDETGFESGGADGAFQLVRSPKLEALAEAFEDELGRIAVPCLTVRAQ